MIRKTLIVFLFCMGGWSGYTVSAHEVPSGSPAPCHTVSLTGTNVSCYNGSNGTVALTISGGSGNFSITWSTGATAVMSLTNLPAGYYDVQVIDLITGCSAFDIINITEPPLLESSLTQVDVKCFGQNTGSIDLSVTGGTPGYTYNWGSGVTTQDRSGLVTGTYAVTITDSKGCTATNSTTIVQPAQAVDKSVSGVHPSCFGYSDGSTDLTVWGGTTPYTYSWNGGTYLSQDLSGIGAGTYNVTVTDANGCTTSTGITLVNPPQLTLSATTTNNNCFGEITGTMDVTVGGGTTPYQYQWANSTYQFAWTQEDADSLSNETYYVTVTDANGCSLNTSGVVTSPPALTLSISGTNVTSFGGSNGSVSTSIGGGVTPYIFSWSNGATSQNLTNIPAGNYVLTVTDDHGCVIIDSIYISEPSDPLTVSLSGTNITCFSGSDGAAEAVGSGGTSPYSFLWSTGETGTEEDSLTAGIYSVTITDAFGNTASDTIELTQPLEFDFVYSITDVSCFGLANGMIDMTVSGGTAPYAYEWLNSSYVLAALTQDIANMPADQYMLTVTDTFGCHASVSVIIHQPDMLELSLSHIDAVCAFSATGSAEAFVTGGTPAYTYLWSDGATSDEISNLNSGTYIVTVTDNQNCFVIDSVFINEPDSISIEYASTPVSCRDQHDGTISAFAEGGNGNYQYLWSTGLTTASLADLYSGEYLLTVTDMMGCTGFLSVFVDLVEVDCIGIPTSFTPNSDGINDTWIIQNSELYPEADYRIHNRWGQEVYQISGTWQPWDGTWKGKPISAETYYYFIRLTPDSETLQGTVTIVR